jgi:hypothetical protein
MKLSILYALFDESNTYLAGWDHDTDLLNSLCELLGLNSAVVVKIKVLEGLKQDLFFTLDAAGFLGQLVLELFLEAAIGAVISSRKLTSLSILETFSLYSNFICYNTFHRPLIKRAA